MGPDLAHRACRAQPRPVGCAARASVGPCAKANTVDLALPVLDEVTHHDGEVAPLKDLLAPLLAAWLRRPPPRSS